MGAGGICSVFELQDHFIKCLTDKSSNLQGTGVLEEFVSLIKPEALSSKEDGLSISINQENSFDFASHNRLRLDFILMRLTQRIIKSGKDLKVVLENVFKTATDAQKSLKPEQFVLEVNKSLMVFITNEETQIIKAQLCPQGKPSLLDEVMNRVCDKGIAFG